MEPSEAAIKKAPFLSTLSEALDGLVTDIVDAEDKICAKFLEVMKNHPALSDEAALEIYQEVLDWLEEDPNPFDWN